MRANGKFWVAKGPSEMVAEGEFHGVNMGHREERVGGWRSAHVRFADLRFRLEAKNIIFP